MEKSDKVRIMSHFSPCHLDHRSYKPPALALLSFVLYERWNNKVKLKLLALQRVTCILRNHFLWFMVL